MAALHPVLRLGEGEQPVDRVHDPRAEAHMRRRRLEGGQHLAGLLTPCPSGLPVNPRASLSVSSMAGDRRRNPLGPLGTALPCASRALSVSIVILCSVGSRRASLSRQRKRQFPLAFEASMTRLRVLVTSALVFRPITSFHEARPARRAFAFWVLQLVSASVTWRVRNATTSPRLFAPWLSRRRSSFSTTSIGKVSNISVLPCSRMRLR